MSDSVAGVEISSTDGKRKTLSPAQAEAFAALLSVAAKVARKVKRTP